MAQRGAGLGIARIFSLLASDAGHEWGHKVAATSSTRLLASGGWVFKTNCLYCSEQLESVRACLHKALAVTSALRLWHPAKTWFVLRAQGCHWLCNATPRLTTIEELLGIDEGQYFDGFNILLYLKSRQALLAWGRMMRLRMQTLVSRHLMLDMWPSNFGFEQSQNALYYVDDEVYYVERFRDILDWGRWHPLI